MFSQQFEYFRFRDLKNLLASYLRRVTLPIGPAIDTSQLDFYGQLTLKIYANCPLSTEPHRFHVGGVSNPN